MTLAEILLHNQKEKQEPDKWWTRMSWDSGLVNRYLRVSKMLQKDYQEGFKHAALTFMVILAYQANTEFEQPIEHTTLSLAEIMLLYLNQQAS